MAGCLGAAPTAAPPDPVPVLQGDIVVDIRMPRDRDDEMQFTVRVTAPSGETRTGTVGTSFQSYVNSLAADEWDVETSGDIQPARPDDVSPYPFIVFSNVSYNQTWIVEVERTRNSSAAGLPAPDPMAPNGCLYLRFSKPNGTLTLNSPDVQVETDPGVSHALVFIGYADQAFAIQRLTDDTCQNT